MTDNNHDPHDPYRYAPEPPPGGAGSDPQGDQYSSLYDDQHGAYEQHDQEYDDQYDYDEYDDYRPPRRGWKGAIAALVAIVIIVGGIFLVGSKGYHFVKDHIGGGPSDYSSSQAHGHVQYTVQPGATGTQMGRDLKKLGVVESVEAFINAYNANPKAAHIAPGTYRLQMQMTSSAAVDALLNTDLIVEKKVLITEGLRATDIAKILGSKTKFPTKAYRKLLAHPGPLGLPDSANGNPEGYLFPATYPVTPDETPTDILKALVTAWKTQTDKLGLAKGLDDNGHQYTPQEVLTVASLVQQEGKSASDMAKIARVIYNRIENPGTEGQTGALQIDSTIDYALNRPLTVGLTDTDKQVDSPYNTYTHTGLPPGPISNPGAEAIQAALHPTPGDWYYYITVNLKTGETKFAETYSQFLVYKAQHDHYCATQSASHCQ
jgi:UPF0755 protein